MPPPTISNLAASGSEPHSTAQQTRDDVKNTPRRHKFPNLLSFLVEINRPVCRKSVSERRPTSCFHTKKKKNSERLLRFYPKPLPHPPQTPAEISHTHYFLEVAEFDGRFGEPRLRGERVRCGRRAGTRNASGLVHSPLALGWRCPAPRVLSLGLVEVQHEELGLLGAVARAHGAHQLGGRRAQPPHHAA